MPVKVFLVEGREIVRLGVRSMLENNPDAHLVGDATTNSEAFEKLKTVEPEVVLIDMSMSTDDILEFTQHVKAKYPAVRVLILTMHDHESSLVKILQGGADGYVLKNTSKDELIFAIGKVHDEGSYMKPNLILNVLEQYKTKLPAPENAAVKLSDREMQVLNLIAEGLTNIQMATKLFTSVRTIETRRKKILEKTGTLNTANLIRYAVLNGLID